LLSFKLHVLVKLAHGTIEELNRYGSEKKNWPKLLSKSLALACHRTTRTDESICNPKGDFHKHLIFVNLPHTNIHMQLKNIGLMEFQR
jgi:hypothetical protein